MPFTIGGEWVPSEPEPQETAKKGGRPVKVRAVKRGKALLTVILNLSCDRSQLEKLAKTLKRQCGCGGTIRDDAIELQGHRVDQVVEILSKEGIKAQ